MALAKEFITTWQLLKDAFAVTHFLRIWQFISARAAPFKKINLNKTSWWNNEIRALLWYWMQVQPGTSPSCTKSVHFSRKMYYHSTQTYRSSKSAVSLTHCPLQVVSQPKRLEKLAKEFQHSARRLTACWMLLVAGPNFKFHNESFRICEKALRSLAVQPSIAISPSAPGSSYLLPSHDIEGSALQWN